LSEKNAVRLVTVTVDDLLPGAFEKLLPDGLPRNHVDEDGPCFKVLTRICVGYYTKALPQPDKPQQAQATPQRRRPMDARSDAGK